MAYVTEQNLIDLFGEQELIDLTQPDNPSATSIDLTRLDAAIAYAEQEANSYLGTVYQLPLTVIPDVLINKVADIARWQLDGRNPRDEVRFRYDKAIEWLKLVARGLISLGDIGSTPITSSASATIGYYNPNATWTRNTLAGY